jgi:hypothetical protein
MLCGGLRPVWPRSAWSWLNLSWRLCRHTWAAIDGHLLDRKGECSERRDGRAARCRCVGIRSRHPQPASEAGALGLSAPCPRLMSQHHSRLDRGVASGRCWQADCRGRAAGARRLTRSSLCTVIPRGHVEIDTVRKRYPRSCTITGGNMSVRLIQGRAACLPLSRSDQRQLQDRCLVANPETELL